MRPTKCGHHTFEIVSVDILNGWIGVVSLKALKVPEKCCSSGEFYHVTVLNRNTQLYFTHTSCEENKESYTQEDLYSVVISSETSTVLPLWIIILQFFSVNKLQLASLTVYVNPTRWIFSKHTVHNHPVHVYPLFFCPSCIVYDFQKSWLSYRCLIS